jgi:type II secretory pathway component GspD/PulD (secretin)
MCRAACLLVLAAVIGVGIGYGQQDATPTKKADPELSKGKRFLYLVRYGGATDLAASVSQHFKGEPGLQIVPEPNANALLVTAPPALSEELVKLFDQLDRRPRQVAIDILMAEIPVDEKGADFDSADFTGPADVVLPKMEQLARKAKAPHLRRFRVSALENQRSAVQVGSSQPHVVGVNQGPFGGRAGGAMQQNVVNYRDVGSLFSVTPRIGADDKVTLDLVLEESRLHTPDDGVAIGGGAIAAEVIRTTLTSKMTIATGHAALAQGVKTEAKDAKVQSIVVVAAKVIDK